MSPFKSKAQQRYLYSKHPDIAKRWEKETPNIKNLPNKVKKSGKKRFGISNLKKYK